MALQNGRVGNHSTVDLDDDLLAEVSETDYLGSISHISTTVAKTTATNEPPVAQVAQFAKVAQFEHVAHTCNKSCEKKYPLHNAAKKEDVVEFRAAILECGRNHKVTDCNGSTVLHHIASAGPPIDNELFEIYKEEYKSELYDKKYIDKPNKEGSTALHIAARQPSVRMLTLLLNHGANDILLDSDDEIAAAVAAYGKDSYPSVQLLVNRLEEEDLRKFGPTVLFNAIYMANCPETIDFLLSRIEYKGLQEEADEKGNPGFSLLHKAAYWTDDDDPQQLECFKRLLAVLDKDDINLLCQRKSWRGKTALHIVAEECAFGLISILVENEFTDLFITCPQKRTVLHAMADSGWSVAREYAINALLNSSKLKDSKIKNKFLGMRDEAGETALELCIRRDSVAFSRTILLAYPDLPQDWLDEILMRKIYEKVPEVMIPLINSGIQFEKKNYEASDELFEANMGGIIGYKRNQDVASYLDDTNKNKFKNTDEPPPKFKRETDFLGIIMDSEHVKSDEQAAVLGHPLIVLFILEKWKKLDELFWISLCTYMILLGLYALFIIDIFWLTCEYKETRDKDCEFASWEIIVSLLTLVAQVALLAIKLTVDVLTIQLRKMINWGNLVQLLFTVGVILIFCGVKTGISPWHHWVASTTILLASFLAFSQFLKIPSLGIYADVLFSVLQKMIRLMITFCPLLIGFTIAISLILPENPKFAFMPYNLIKILVMMTGEINFDDVFHAEYKTPFKDYAILIFALFTVIVSIVIFNLLLGFTISDIQALEADSANKILASTLEQIVVFERIVLSDLIQWMLPNSFLRRYLVVTHEPNKVSRKDYCRVMEEIPTKLRKMIQALAAEQQQQRNKTEQKKD